MTAKLVKSASNDGQITKSELSDGRRAKLLPSVAESPYDWLQFEDYLGNVGKINAANPGIFCPVYYGQICRSYRHFLPDRTLKIFDDLKKSYLFIALDIDNNWREICFY